MVKKYALVIVDLSHQDVDRPFHYRIPDKFQDTLFTGSRVIVPFGNGNKQYEGYVVGFDDTVDFPEAKVKEILAVPDSHPLLNRTMLELAFWMRDKYYSTFIQCAHCMVPVGVKWKSNGAFESTGKELQPLRGKKKQIAGYIVEREQAVAERELVEMFGNIAPFVRELEEQGYVRRKQLSEIKDLTYRIRCAALNDGMVDFESLVNVVLAQNSQQAKVLYLLKEKGRLPVADIREYLKISESPVKTLEKKQLIRFEWVVVRRNPILNGDANLPEIGKPVLNKEQAAAYGLLREGLRHGENKPYLIHGVTGSGKTEIYMHIIEDVLNAGKQAIVLVPEIALTPQAVEVFIARFGSRVTVTHSRLSMGERFDQWEKARLGEVSIMLGPRSAIFTPFENLGLIIIDEEHEHTYKSETSPKYDAKEVAIKLGQLTGAMVVLGSATPRIETYYEAEQGEINLLALSQRVNQNPPEVYIADMRMELATGNRTIFSKQLSRLLLDEIPQGRQAILFLNRRGHSTFVSCRSCGHVLACNDCQVNYTYHVSENKLVCHYCGNSVENPENCPVCGSKYIRYFGIGTQKVEKEIHRLFPQFRTLRMDMDTTAGKHSHQKILTAFKNKEADILIGTQMIAKGLDFPNVSVVGVIAADVSLFTGDFRSGEITFQLLTQVSGRAGRAEFPGTVVIQTYQPDHYSIGMAKTGDYLAFYQEEIALRRQMEYPPFSHIFCIMCVADDEKNMIKTLFRLADQMQAADKAQQFVFMGPSPCIISKLKKKYRWKLLVKGLEEEGLKTFVLSHVQAIREKCPTDMQFYLTLNPMVIP